MGVPIIIHHESDPDRCPKCNNVENIKEVCANCGYEYKNNGASSLLYGIIYIVSVVFAVWFLITLADWLIAGNESLLETIQGQWKFLKSRRIW